MMRLFAVCSLLGCCFFFFLFLYLNTWRSWSDGKYNKNTQQQQKKTRTALMSKPERRRTQRHALIKILFFCSIIFFFSSKETQKNIIIKTLLTWYIYALGIYDVYNNAHVAYSRPFFLLAHTSLIIIKTNANTSSCNVTFKGNDDEIAAKW